MSDFMTIEEIMKALECCPDYTVCSECPCFDFCGCTPKLFENTLFIISRYKTENKILKERIKSQKHALFEQQSYTTELQKQLANIKSDKA